MFCHLLLTQLLESTTFNARLTFLTLRSFIIPTVAGPLSRLIGLISFCLFVPKPCSKIVDYALRITWVQNRKNLKLLYEVVSYSFLFLRRHRTFLAFAEIYDAYFKVVDITFESVAKVFQNVQSLQFHIICFLKDLTKAMFVAMRSHKSDSQVAGLIAIFFNILVNEFSL